MLRRCLGTSRVLYREVYGVDNLFIYLFIYLAGCTMYPHLPEPIYQLCNLLPPFASVVPVFFH
jgi:hypothetical protein